MPGTDAERISEIANRLNNRIHEIKGRSIEDAWPSEARLFLRQLIEAMEKHLPNLSPTGGSRLAWLHLHTQNEDRAREIALKLKGIGLDPDNEHCQKLARKLDL